ncbi:MAG: hypothetical protein M3271_02275 [Actinomycetota bacterium]|nr:hypothetical protein [Actinomycetota bacterium]
MRIHERLFLRGGDVASQEHCSECGAELRLRPASCPLCGRETPFVAKERVAIDLDDYQSNVRSLREELRRIRRDDAEAV